MKAIIHYNGKYEDTLVVEANTLEEVREITFAEADRRGWEYEKCWSEVDNE